MKKIYVITILLFCVASLAFTGCATIASSTNMLTDEKIRSATSGVLGYSPNDLTILSRRTEGTNTYVNLRANDEKEFTCVINGGNLLTMGMTNPATCSKKGEPINTNPFQQATSASLQQPSLMASRAPEARDNGDKSASPQSKTITVATVALVMVKTANVRSAPSTKAKIISTLKPGETVGKIGESGSWLNIKLASGESGWVSKPLAREAERPGNDGQRGGLSLVRLPVQQIAGEGSTVNVMAGTLVVKTAMGEPKGSVRLNDKIVFELVSVILDRAYRTKTGDVLILTSMPGSHFAYPFQFLTIKADGSYAVSKEYGNQSYPKIHENGDEIVLDFPANSTGRAETVVFRNGEIMLKKK